MIRKERRGSKGKEEAVGWQLCILAVGVLAFDQVRTLQRNPSKQTSGPAVGENCRGAAQSHVSLHVPEKHKHREGPYFCDINTLEIDRYCSPVLNEPEKSI